MIQQIYLLVTLVIFRLSSVQGAPFIPLTPTTRVTDLATSGFSTSSEKTTSTSPRTTGRLLSNVASSTSFIQSGTTSVPFTSTVITAGLSKSTPRTSTFSTSTSRTSILPTSTTRTSTFSTSTPRTLSVSTSTPKTSQFQTSTPRTSHFSTSTPRTSTFSTSTPRTSNLSTSTPRTSTFSTSTPRTSISSTSTPRTSNFSTYTPRTSTLSTSNPRTSTFTIYTPRTSTLSTSTLATTGVVTSTPTRPSSFSSSTLTTRSPKSTPTESLSTSTTTSTLSTSARSFTFSPSTPGVTNVFTSTPKTAVLSATTQGPEASSLPYILGIATSSSQQTIFPKDSNAMTSTYSEPLTATKRSSESTSVQTGIVQLTTRPEVYELLYNEGTPMFPLIMTVEDSPDALMVATPTTGISTGSAFDDIKGMWSINSPKPILQSSFTEDTLFKLKTDEMDEALVAQSTSGSPAFEIAKPTDAHETSTNMSKELDIFPVVTKPKMTDQLDSSQTNFDLAPWMVENFSVHSDSSTARSTLRSFNSESTTKEFKINSDIADNANYTMNSSTDRYIEITTEQMVPNITKIVTKPKSEDTTYDSKETALDETPFVIKQTYSDIIPTNTTRTTTAGSTTSAMTASPTSHAKDNTGLSNADTQVQDVSTSTGTGGNLTAHPDINQLLYIRGVPVFSLLLPINAPAPKYEPEDLSVVKTTTGISTGGAFDVVNGMLNINSTKPILQTSFTEDESSKLKTDDTKEVLVAQSKSGPSVFGIVKPTDAKVTSTNINQAAEIVPVVTKPKMTDQLDSSPTNFDLAPWMVENFSEHSDTIVTKPTTSMSTAGALATTTTSALQYAGKTITTPTPSAVTWTPTTRRVASSPSLISTLGFSTTPSYKTSGTSQAQGVSTTVANSYLATTSERNYRLIPIMAISLLERPLNVYVPTSTHVASSAKLSTTSRPSSSTLSSSKEDHGNNTYINGTVVSFMSLNCMESNSTGLNGTEGNFITSNETMVTLKALNETMGHPMTENGTRSMNGPTRVISPKYGTTYSSTAMHETSDPAKSNDGATSEYPAPVVSSSELMKTTTNLPTTVTFESTTKKLILYTRLGIDVNLLLRGVNIPRNTLTLTESLSTKTTDIGSDLVTSSPAPYSNTRGLNTTSTQTLAQETPRAFDDIKGTLNINFLKPMLQTSFTEDESSKLKTDDTKEALVAQSTSGPSVFEIAKPTDSQVTSTNINQEVDIFPPVTKPKVTDQLDGSQTNIDRAPWIGENVSVQPESSTTPTTSETFDSESTVKEFKINSSIADNANYLIPPTTGRHIGKSTEQVVPNNTTVIAEQHSKETTVNSKQYETLFVDQTVTSSPNTPITASPTRPTKKTMRLSSEDDPSEPPMDYYFYDASRGARVGGPGLLFFIGLFLFGGAMLI